jgi:hypothetical protein
MAVVKVNLTGLFTDTPVAPFMGSLKRRIGGRPPGIWKFALFETSESKTTAPLARPNPPAPEPLATASNKQLRKSKLKTVLTAINRKRILTLRPWQTNREEFLTYEAQCKFFRALQRAIRAIEQFKSNPTRIQEARLGKVG